MDMQSFSGLISALANIAWPALLAIIIFIFHRPLSQLLESIRGRKIVIKVAGNELTVEEASEQQRQAVTDIQLKIAEIEKKLDLSEANPKLAAVTQSAPDGTKTVLWVDDNPKNNSYLVASLKDRGVSVDIALSTNDGIEKFKSFHYDWIISDMGRPEGERAGIDFTKKIRAINKKIPIYIFCSLHKAKYMQDEALEAGVTGITSSGTTLLSMLPY